MMDSLSPCGVFGLTWEMREGGIREEAEVKLG